MTLRPRWAWPPAMTACPIAAAVLGARGRESLGGPAAGPASEPGASVPPLAGLPTDVPAPAVAGLEPDGLPEVVLAPAFPADAGWPPPVPERDSAVSAAIRGSSRLGPGWVRSGLSRSVPSATSKAGWIG